MHAEIRTVREPVLRVQIVEERTSFDRDPQEWIDTYKDQQNELRESLIAAKNILPDVKMDYENRVRISQVCSELKVDGLRGDIVVNRAAKAYTAFNSRTDVTVDDISKIITLCLRHRLRKDPLESIDSGDKVKKVFNEIFEFTDEV
jgi:magnesium chelatase subunit I